MAFEGSVTYRRAFSNYGDELAASDGWQRPSCRSDSCLGEAVLVAFFVKLRGAVEVALHKKSVLLGHRIFCARIGCHSACSK